MTTDLLVGAGMGIAVGASITYGIYLNWRIKRLEDAVYTFPTIDEIAKEIMSMKIRPEDVPPDIKEAFDKMFGPGGPKKPDEKPSYMG